MPNQSIILKLNLTDPFVHCLILFFFFINFSVCTCVVLSVVICDWLCTVKLLIVAFKMQKKKTTLPIMYYYDQIPTNLRSLLSLFSVYVCITFEELRLFLSRCYFVVIHLFWNNHSFDILLVWTIIIVMVFFSLFGPVPTSEISFVRDWQKNTHP